MGNQRQQLKVNIASDLQKKIENVQLTLTKLKSEQENVEKSCVQVKNEIQQTADSITHQLLERKACLMKEVDLIGQSQINSLQGNIESTYLALGSLQSTLSNLDSFDTSQLLNLQMPNSSNVPYLRPQWSANTNCDQVVEKINHWGVITVSPLSEKMQVKIWNKVPKYNPINFEWDSVGDICFGSHEVPSPVLPRLEHIPFSATTGNKCGNDPKYDIEQWLSYKLESDPDDFEMLFLENELQNTRLNRDGDSVVPDVDVEDKEIVYEDITVDANASQDTVSSILCIKTEHRPSKIDELSMWLKPKTTPDVASLGSSTQELHFETLAPIPPEMIQKSKSVTTSTVSSKSRLLDYPGLRLDPRCWLHKKSKAQQDLFKLSAEISLNMSQKEIIPPAYAALPYPFWLKKC